MEEVEELTSDVLAYLESPEAFELLLTKSGSRRHDIHLEKLPHELTNLADIHPEKLPYEIRRLLSGLTASVGTGEPWIKVDERLANFYMTLLATRLSERIVARLSTSLPSADRLAVTARLNAQSNGIIPSSSQTRWRHSREYEAFGPRNRTPQHLAIGMLANLAIERIGVSPDTPVDRLIEFREKYRDELSQFQTKIETLASSVEADLPIEALRQRVTDLYEGEVQPAISNLKAALDGKRITWIGGGLLKIAFLSAGPTSLLVTTGLNIPTALLAGAGISLIASRSIYNVDKQESLRANPFAYLLSAEKALS